MRLGPEENAIYSAIEVIFTERGPDFHQKIFEDLKARYSEPQRYYHTMRHIGEFLAEASQFELEDKKAFLAAILFHDAVYDPKRYARGYEGISNEGESAEICERVLKEAGVEQKTIDRAKDLIIMTYTHKAPEGDREALLFMDMDMCIIAAKPPRYHEYCIDVYREYLSVFTPEEFITGRTAFLSSLDAEKSLFKTPEYSARKTDAFHNSQTELQNLEAWINKAASLMAESNPAAKQAFNQS